MGGVALLEPKYPTTIETGSTVVKAKYSEGTEVSGSPLLATAAPRVKSHTPLIPDLPSVAGLVVETGQGVAEGELIACFVDDAGLDAHRFTKRAV